MTNAECLKSWQFHCGFTQKKAASALGIDVATYKRYIQTPAPGTEPKQIPKAILGMARLVAINRNYATENAEKIAHWLKPG